MIVGRTNGRRFWLSVLYSLIPVVSFALAGLVRFSLGTFRPGRGPDWRSYFGFCLLATLIWVFVNQSFRLGDIPTLSAIHRLWENAVKAWFLSLVLTMSATFFYRDVLFSRIFLAV